MHVNLPSFTGKIAGTREKYKFSEIGVRTTNLQIFPWTLLTKKEMSKPTSEISRDPAAETLKKRVLVAEAYKQTNNVAQVARKYGVSKKYVRRWGKRDLAGEANMFQDAPRSGRPCKLTEEKQAAILACVDDKHNGIKCARHIRNHVQPGVSLTTVKRFLRREKCHYSGQVKVRRPSRRSIDGRDMLSPRSFTTPHPSEALVSVTLRLSRMDGQLSSGCVRVQRWRSHMTGIL